MTSTLRTGDSISPEGEDKPKDSGRSNQLLPTMSLRPHSTPQGSRRLQTRRKIGNKTPEVEKFLVESLRRDPGSGQAQLNEADLQQIVNMMEFYEFAAQIGPNGTRTTPTTKADDLRDEASDSP
ncbi:unnamed protein product [Durusdinium trenchii]|uniref:Uncharacterized protein n=1 Tax=Durusdinium trenchii TaxID=1381693 RepID=A0ABP0SEL7_9DINO